MSIPIAVVEALIDPDNGLTDSERLRYLRDAIERQRRINARRTVIDLPDERPTRGWIQFESGDPIELPDEDGPYDPRD